MILFYMCLLVSFFMRFRLIQGSLDLFVDGQEAKKLLGVQSEIWYVKNGNIDAAALSYVIKVPTEIDFVSFNWKNSHHSIMPYTLDVSVNNRHAIQSPTLIDIAHKGIVPNTNSTWSVALVCTGNFITQAHVNITLKVPLTHSLKNISTLVIQRQKICSRKIRSDVSVESLKRDDSNNIVYIILGFATTFLACALLVVVVVHYIRVSKRRNHPVLRCSHPATLPIDDTETSGLKTTDVSMSDICQSPHSVESIFAMHHPVTNQFFLDPRDGDIDVKMNQLAAKEEDLIIDAIQLEGNFGKIYMGRFFTKNPRSEMNVVVKTVAERASEVQRKSFVSEGTMLAGLNHENVLPVIAVVNSGSEHPKLIFPNYSHVNLKKFLQGANSILSREVVCLGSQALNALSFLHSKCLVHKDVASRNCVVDDSWHLKLCDCALARDLFPQDYHYSTTDNSNRPVKWLALESLDHKIFSPASDLWSWGVLLWELMTLGQQPYLQVDSQEMVAVLTQGLRLAQPINCPDQLFKAMTYCWNSNPQQRPTVSELQTYLQRFLQHLDTFV